MFSTPMGGTDIELDGCIGPKSQAFYEYRAKGGCAAVTVSELMVHSSDGSHAYRLDESILNSLPKAAYTADATGSPCHIYVQNEAWFTDGAGPRPWHSVPTFITDSKVLAPILHGGAFIGEGIRDDEGLHIRFYTVHQ